MSNVRNTKPGLWESFDNRIQVWRYLSNKLNLTMPIEVQTLVDQVSPHRLPSNVLLLSGDFASESVSGKSFRNSLYKHLGAIYGGFTRSKTDSGEVLIVVY